jgi:FkbM family methyltransferase
MYKVIRKSDCHEEDIKVIFDEFNDIPLKGVVHLGAHKGEEVFFYQSIGIGNIILIEANPNLYDDLVKNTSLNGALIFNYAVSDYDGEVDFYVHQSNNGIESSSIFKMDKFDKIVTSLQTKNVIKVPSKSLKSIFKDNNLEISSYNILVSDIQGADYFALLGAGELLNYFDAVVVEVQFLELYDSYVPIEKFDNLLSKYGFRKILIIEHELYKNNDIFPGWGEVLYKKV